MHDFADFRSAKFHEICTQDVDLRGGESFRKNICENLPVRGLFPKRQILAVRLQRLRTSGRDISEMITNLGKS